jgi:hypothetical protein
MAERELADDNEPGHGVLPGGAVPIPPRPPEPEPQK